MDGTEPTVYVVDDDEAVSSSLSWLLESIGLRVRTYRNALDFIAAMDADPWGCLVLDVRMPGMSGLELQQRLRDRDVGLPVIFITGHGGVANAVKAIKAGAFDFLEKPFDDQTLLDRVQQAIGVNSETRRCRSARAALLDRYASLTPREREVMELVVEGRPNKVIAQVLGLSSKTVEAHRAPVPLGHSGDIPRPSARPSAPVAGTRVAAPVRACPHSFGDRTALRATQPPRGVASRPGRRGNFRGACAISPPMAHAPVFTATSVVRPTPPRRRALC